MSKKSNHVISSKSGGWAVKKSSSSRASKVFSTKEEAKTYGIEISKRERTELYIHSKDGTIQDRNSYGSNGYALKDRKN